MAENTIEIPITSESITNLKRAVQTLKDAYIREASGQISENESAILPIILPQVEGLEQDIIASKDTVDNYDKMTIDDLGDGSSLDLESYNDLDNISGNYSMTPDLSKEIKKEVSNLTANSQSKKSLGSVDLDGGDFVDTTQNAFGSDGTNDPGTQQRNIQAEETVISSSATNLAAATSFRNTRRGKNQGELFKNCIPCDLRKYNLDEINPLTGILDILEEDLLNNYTRLINQIKSLLSNNDIRDDLCNLLNFLEFQCLPDLYGIISLLTALSSKLADTKLINFQGAFMQFLTPFFGPLLNGVNELLDKYIQLIMGPIDCVLDSLDTQLAKLDVNSAIDEGTKARVSDILTRRSFLTRKRDELRQRRKFLLEKDDSGNHINEPGVYEVKDRRANEEGIFERQGDVNVVDFRTDRAGLFVTREEELRQINEDIAEIEGEDGKGGLLGELQEEYNTLKSENSSLGGLKVATDFISESRKDLSDFRNTAGSSLQMIRNYVVEGKIMMEDTAAVWRKELQRTLFGRAATTDELLQGAADLQRIARIIGIVRAIIQLANTGKLCENKNDIGASLGSFLVANRNGDVSNNAPNVAKGRDTNGNEVLLVTTSDAVLDLGTENETGKTSKLSEISDLNAQGVTPDVGVVPNNVTARSNELGEVPVAVLRFNLCGDISKSTESDLANIKEWASNLGI